MRLEFEAAQHGVPEVHRDNAPDGWDSGRFLSFFVALSFSRFDGEANIELIKFRNPPDENGIQKPFANTLGIRHITFVVEDIEAVLAKLRKNGAEIFNGVQQYEDS